MNRWVKRLGLGALWAMPIAYAAADWNFTPGAGGVFFSFICQTTKVCGATALIDAQGIEKGTQTNPVITQVPGGTQPVSGSVGVSGNVTAAQGTPAAIANAWPTTITQGGSTANVVAGRLQVDANVSGGGTGGGGTVTQGLGGTSPWLVSPSNVANTTPWLMTIRQGTNTANVTAGNRLQVDSVGTTTLSNSSVSITGPVTTVASAPSTGGTGCTPAHFLSAATNNARSVKGSAGILCSLSLINTTASSADLRLYDTAAVPTCSSATGAVLNFPVQANTVGPGFAIPLGPYGMNFTNGIGICLTANNADNDNTSAVTGINVNYAFK